MEMVQYGSNVRDAVRIGRTEQSQNSQHQPTDQKQKLVVSLHGLLQGHLPV
jgi:hypothetical protein